jgi:hypothetical protein
MKPAPSNPSNLPMLPPPDLEVQSRPPSSVGFSLRPKSNAARVANAWHRRDIVLFAVAVSLVAPASCALPASRCYSRGGSFALAFSPLLPPIKIFKLLTTHGLSYFLTTER